jgi:pyruvate/2-oxoglutarate dehydrogenase complex dihydrolipoamide dehydrogenase (E3) component
VQLVVDANTRKVLGAHMVGEHAGEIMQVSGH